MKTIPTRFFTLAALAALVGMIWGIQMSASHDHMLSPAHGHLNLVGFVTMAVFGTYYALTPRAANSALAKVHFWLATAAAVVLAPGIAMAITERGEVVAQVGSLLAVVSMALFAFTVARYGVGTLAVVQKDG